MSKTIISAGNKDITLIHNNQTINLKPKAGNKIVISEEPIHDDTNKNFDMVGEVNEMNGLKILMLELTKGERVILYQMIEARDYKTNRAIITHNYENTSDKEKFSRAYKSLERKHLVYRVSPHRKGVGTVYMINPELIKIATKYKDEPLIQWRTYMEQLKLKSER